jgi:hypothetical protein
MNGLIADLLLALKEGFPPLPVRELEFVKKAVIITLCFLKTVDPQT